MRWSWRGGPIDTVVSFDLAPVALADVAATRLVVEQRGFEGLPAVIVSFILGAGSNEVYGRRLPAVLDRLAGRPIPADVTSHRRMTAPWRLLTRAFGPLLRRSERRTRR
jgi:hypothetical protein